MGKHIAKLWGKFVTLSAFMALIYQPEALAGAWLLPKGQAQVITSTTVSKADERFDRQGRLSGDVEFSKQSAEIYAEYGVSSNWTLGGKAAAQNVSYSSADQDVKYTQIGPIEIWARRSLWTGSRSVVSAQFGAVYESAFKSDQGVELSGGNYGYETRLLAGRGFELAGRSGFVEGQIAYLNRASGGLDEAKLDVTAGLHLRKDVEWITQAFAVKALNPEQSALGYERVKLQSSLFLQRKERLRYQAGLFHTASGKNNIAEIGVIWASHVTY